jgi:hypothetical protein
MAKTRSGEGEVSQIFLASDAAAREAELVDRLIASAAGLPRVCALKQCRRRKRCFGPLAGGELPCMRQHRGLARERLQDALRVLGWSDQRG